MPWDPSQYDKFQSQRSAPFFDLLDLVNVQENLRVVDLGCGTGQLTEKMLERLPRSRVLGIDNSSSMLEKSKQYERDQLKFKLLPIEELDGQWDVVFSNAAIQWIENHNDLIPKLCELVKPGGQLVIQLPSNQDHPSHKFILELAESTPYQEALDNWVRIPPVLQAEEYAKLLFKSGMEDVNVFEKIYPHVLEDANAIAEWTSGTALVPYFERFSSELKDAFMAEYRAKLKNEFPENPVFYPFKRILFSARRN